MRINKHKLVSLLLIGSIFIFNTSTNIFSEDNSLNSNNILDEPNNEGNNDSNIQPEDKIVEIKDKNLLKCINISLGNEDIYKEVTVKDMETLEELKIEDEEIKEINGLEYAKNLRKLEIISNEIEEISLVSKLSNLESLYIRSNKIDKVDFLIELSNLKELSLVELPINEISFVSELNNLQTLVLSENNIKDISILSAIENIEDIHININNQSLENEKIILNKYEDISIKLPKIKHLNEDIEVNYIIPSELKYNEDTYEAIFTPNEDGIYKFEIEFNDGDVGKFSGSIIQEVIIDKEGPSVEVECVDKEDNSKEILIKAKDSISGIDKIVLPNGEVIEGNEASFIVHKSGTYEFVVYDKANNKTVKELEINITTELVTINEIPVIKAEDTEIIKGEIFDPLANVSAIDKEDGDISNKIIVITNTVDTSKVGEYKVRYEVSDSTGGKSIKEIVVRVIENNEEDNEDDDLTNPDDESKDDEELDKDEDTSEDDTNEETNTDNNEENITTESLVGESQHKDDEVKNLILDDKTSVGILCLASFFIGISFLSDKTWK